jgi:uncharacterized membrane protein YhhN
VGRVSLILFLLLAAVDWVAVWRRDRRLEYFAKPAALIALLAYAACSGRSSPWLVLALLFSLAGDVFLMLPADLFLAGLGSFLVGHLAYIACFTAPTRARLIWWLILTVICAPLASRILRSAGDGGTRAGVAVYMLVLGLMVASAIASGSGVAALGAGLFLASDSIIAWNRFVAPVPLAQPLIMSTYHLGQLGLVAALRAG